MLGPYTARDDGTVSYRGNRICPPIADISAVSVPIDEFGSRVTDFESDAMWGHIARINHRINLSANVYLSGIGALFTALPMTTRMISSPGAVYGKEAIDYTTDTCPITLKWFDLPDSAFLSESSQIYLELALMQKDVDSVYSIYNSFRKEKADSTHLSEFHHIEFEGRVDQPRNEDIALELTARIILDLITGNRDDLAYFLTDDRIEELEHLARTIDDIPRVTFAEALELLYAETGDERYTEITLRHFGTWEEVKLSELLGSMVLVREFPLLEVPFYHAVLDEDANKANNSDIIWPGYREFIGSGSRVRSREELESKSRLFNLPRDDYQPYLQTRSLKSYEPSSGFGIGWERLLQGILEMPFIWSVCQFPRVDGTLRP